MKLNVILTGATGMVGEGVLHECLQHADVEKILIINRKPTGLVHPKLKEIIHTDFFDLSSIEDQLKGYNACLFCLGVSSVGMKEAEFTKFTYTLTMRVATTLAKHNPQMTFCYISGSGTDSSEKGKLMWARVKGKAENDLAKLAFRKTYAFRPGIIKPTKGLKNTLPVYKYLGWLFPFISLLAGKSICTLQELGLAMINASSKGYEKSILEIKDILILSKR